VKPKTFCEKHQQEKVWKFFEKMGRGWWHCDACAANRTQNYRIRNKIKGACSECPNAVEVGKTKCPFHMELSRKRNVAENLELKLSAFTEYGGIKCSCSCGCSIDRHELLTIEHVGGRKGTPTEKMFGVTLYRWLKTNSYPDKDKLKVFCMNCNFAWGHFGYCPEMKN